MPKLQTDPEVSGPLMRKAVKCTTLVDVNLQR